MRFYDLIGLSDEEANGLIKKCPKEEIGKVIDNPEILLGKLLVFRGNFDGFDTDRLCARTIEYLPKEDRWRVSDVTIYDMFTSSFYHHFSGQELKSMFDCKSEGFIMDA